MNSTLSIPRFVLARLRDGAVVLFLVVLTIFVLAFVVGNPVEYYAPPDATQEEIDRLNRILGFDRPFHVQFADYFGGLVRGDFGDSLFQRRPAIHPILEALPATILLSLTGIAVAGLWGAVTGVIAGVRPGSIFDRVANFLSVSMVSVPNFWLGLLLIVIFAVQLRALPTSGFFDPKGLILPTLTLGLVHGGRIFLIVRSVTFEETTKPYVMVAESKGLPFSYVVGRHILRNAGVTIATTVGWEYVRMMGGTAFAIEFVFAWPGVGNLMIDSANRQDFPVLQAGVILTGVFVIVANIVVDLGSKVVDRRLQPA